MAATSRDAFPPPPHGSRPIGWAAVACSLTMLAWMGRALVTGRVPFTGDLLHFHYPLRDFYARALASGQRFDWMPSLFNGFHVVGEGQLGAYHPLHWLLYRVLPLDRAFAIELVLAYPVLFAGAWLWLRGRVGAAPAAFGAMAMTFSGFMLTHGVHPNVVGVLAHLPWLLVALDTVSGGPVRAAGAIALLTGSQLLLGHPQSVWFSALVEAPYVLYLALAGAVDRRVRLVASWLTGLVLGASIGAVQVLATFDAWSHSTRPVYDAAYATAFSLRPLHLLQFLHPYLFWGRVSRWNEAPGAGDEYGVYGGAAVLLLAVWWMAQSVGRSGRLPGDGESPATRRFGWCVAALGAVGLWLATGSHGRLYLVQTWLPVVSGFRAPVRYTLFTQWALAVLASLALARLLLLRAPSSDAAGSASSNGRTARCALLATVAVAAITAWLVPGAAVLSPGEAVIVRWFGPFVLAVSGGLIVWAARGARVALVLLVVLAAADQALYGLRGVVAWQDFVTRPQAIGYLDTDAFLHAPPEGRLVRGGFPNLYLLAGYRLVDGYVAIEPAKQLDYRRPEALRLAQAEFANQDFFKGRQAPEGRPLERGWLRLPSPLPRARLVAEAQMSVAPRDDLSRVDIARVALVTHDLRLPSGTAGAVRITRDAPGEIRVVTQQPTRQLLVVSESFDEGWTVEVDGAVGAVERVYGDFLGVVVPAGEHAVTFLFRPRRLEVGRWLSLASAVAAIGLVVAHRVRR